MRSHDVISNSGARHMRCRHIFITRNARDGISYRIGGVLLLPVQQSADKQLLTILEMERRAT